MNITELLLKTLFCCSACDGEIASEEIELVKNITEKQEIFSGINVEDTLNKYVDEINSEGKQFLRSYLNELSDSELSEADQIKLVDLAIQMIEADNQILYSEVKFFKKIRSRLTVEDSAILEALPESEDYLLPDISSEDKDFEDVGNFQQISFDTQI
ncbi:MAG: TerB family tellurite resistance protein [Duncaniella sp.]|nr:TerB family tellurite resistance protein [Duncaniella sp.]MCM1400944.1 TerB family tellurite resistance protein [Bacteroides sp.]MCM1476295.1 TerB family tellurite resistance protein [Bacteroides sp.]